MKLGQLLILTTALIPGFGHPVRADSPPAEARPADARSATPISAEVTVQRVDTAARRFLVQVPGARSGKLLVSATEQTQFQWADGTAATLEEIVVGAPVWVEGPTTGSGLLAAQRVILSDAEDGKAVMGKGTVSSVDAEGKKFTVQPEGSRSKSLTVTLVKTTVWRKGDGSTPQFAEVVTGMEVEIQGVSTEGDQIAAQKVILSPNIGKAVSGMGTLLAADIGSRRLVVQPQDGRSPRVTVSFTEATQFQRSDSSPASLADLAIGAAVWIQGVSTGTHTLSAQKVVLASGNRGVRRGR